MAYLEAKGIARFPDGGTPDYLIEDVALYCFYPSGSKLHRLADVSDLVEITGPYRSNIESEIVLFDSMIYFRAEPSNGWDFYVKLAKNADDSAKVWKMKEKYSQVFSVDPEGNNKPSTLPGKNDGHDADLTKLNNMIDEVPLSEWGLLVQEIFPKSDEDYIEETIYLKNHSFLTRRAVIEQIISKLPPDDIKSLLQKMDEHQHELEGLEKTEYEVYSKETRNLIEGLIK